MFRRDDHPTTFTWDIAAGLPVVLDDGNQYLYGAGLSAMKQGSAWSYYLADGLGSTMAVVDASGAVQKAYQYDVYGEVTGGSGSLANEFDFAGQQTDATGLQYLRARYYDPASGVFLSREPLACSSSCMLNGFAYAGSSPAQFVDPAGNAAVDSDPGGGRSDCAGLWSKIVNTVNAIVDAAKTWYENGYGKWDTGYGSAPGALMTAESRARHYVQFDTLQRSVQDQLDDYFARGSSKQKKPCPPPGGGAWKSAQNALVLLTAEYFKGKSLDDAARHWDRAAGGRGWSWSWPKPPGTGNSQQ